MTLLPQEVGDGGGCQMGCKITLINGISTWKAADFNVGAVYIIHYKTKFFMLQLRP
jgi:hypothetical protein